MTELKKLAELNALICEVQAVSLEADAVKVANREKEIMSQYPIYHEADFMKLAKKVREIADKFRKLGAVK